MAKLIYPELSYKIVGVLYETYNELGFGYQEKYYQRAIKIRFEKYKIKFSKENMTRLQSDGKIIGRYFVDFTVEKKIVLELKIANDFYKKDINQVLGYLKATGLRLGILAIFTKDGLKYKRIVN
ncbi:MAG: GxxExxY protein [Patescibacteria group bacterium]|nr:GxxExxY protein [Patescibacteria group bacterium]